MPQAPFAFGNPPRRCFVPHDSTHRHPRSNYRRLLVLFLVGLADCFLVLAYWPLLADSLEASLFDQPAPSPPPALLLSPNPASQNGRGRLGIDRPPVLPADKAPLDDDTPVIGVLASGQARAYLIEAFEHGPGSHVVNDLLGSVPISVTHCDISGCTRVFTGATPGQPLQLAAAGLRDGRLVLKLGGHLYGQETSEPLDEGSAAFPCREYPAEATIWSDWRRAHPDTDVYMGSIDEPTPPEAGGPRILSPRKLSSDTHHTS